MLWGGGEQLRHAMLRECAMLRSTRSVNEHQHHPAAERCGSALQGGVECLVSTAVATAAALQSSDTQQPSSRAHQSSASFTAAAQPAWAAAAPHLAGSGVSAAAHAAAAHPLSCAASPPLHAHRCVQLCCFRGNLQWLLLSRRLPRPGVWGVHTCSPRARVRTQLSWLQHLLGRPANRPVPA